jgi:hypothetical protein
MMPILEFPNVVQQYGDIFEEIFSFHQLHRFKQYITGLITGRNKTVSGIASNFMEGTDQSSVNRFLTEYSWDEDKLNDKRLEILQSDPLTKWSKKGVISIDDTLLEKTGKNMPGAGKLFDHAEGKFVNAQNLITSNYVDKTRDYPISFRQYYKHDSIEAKEHGFKTKIDLAKDLVGDCEKRSVPAMVYAFDAWFLSSDLTSHIESFGKGWVSRLKPNRIIFVSGIRQSVKAYADSLPRESFKAIEVNGKTYYAFSKVVKVSKLGKARLVISYDNAELNGEPAYIVTSYKDWDETRIVGCYSMRFPIETFYRDAKQNLGLGSCQLRSSVGTMRHWCLVNLAYSLLKLEICKSRTYKRLISDKTIGSQCRKAVSDTLRSLVSWVYQSVSSGMSLDCVLKVLKM